MLHDISSKRVHKRVHKLATLNKLSATQLKTLKSGDTSDGGGLWFRKRGDGGAQWILRYSIGGRRNIMGLGGWPQLSLKQARDLRDQFQGMAKSGIDPKSARAAQRVSASNDNTFEALAFETFEANKHGFKRQDGSSRWMSPLKMHVFKHLGKITAESINQQMIADCLKPIWHSKPDTARKCLGRINKILLHAAAKGLNVDISIVLKARILLGEQNHEEISQPSMPYADIPTFYASLCSDDRLVCLGLRLLILTGHRTTPIIKLRANQISGDVWIAPKENMKGQKGKVQDFHCPLSDEAQLVITKLRRQARDGWLFPTVSKRSKTGHMSDSTMSKYMRVERGLPYVPHGFRTSMRTWIEEVPKSRWQVAESTLAHAVGNKVSKKYLDTDWLPERRDVLQQWSNFVTSEIHG